MPEIYDAGTMDPDEVAFGQLASDRCEVERNYEAATSCQVDAGITSGSLYPLDFVHCRFEIVIPATKVLHASLREIPLLLHLHLDALPIAQINLA